MVSFLVGVLVGAIAAIIFLWKKKVINSEDVTSIVINDETDGESV